MKKENESSVFDIAYDAESATSEARVIFNPRAYLAHFYEGEVDPGNRALLHFYARAYADLEGRSLLEFGNGPTLYSLITAARTASWIHCCDYNSASLDEVLCWLAHDSSAFDWRNFTICALEYEKGEGEGHGESPSEEEIQARHDLIRQRIRKLSRCDAFADDMLLGESMGPYGVVANTFCLDSITHDRREWMDLNRKLASLVEKDGLYATVSLLNASHWTHQDATCPAVTLTPTDITNMYAELGFTITYSSIIENLEGKVGYDGFFMVCGRRQF